MALLVVGDRTFGDTKRVVETINTVFPGARLLAARRVEFWVTPQAGDLLMKLVTLPSWGSSLKAAGPGAISLDQVSDPMATAPDLTVLFWEPRRRRPDLVKLAFEIAQQDYPTRCYAYAGEAAIGPLPLPSIPTDWNGGMDGCPLCLGLLEDEENPDHG